MGVAGACLPGFFIVARLQHVAHCTHDDFPLFSLKHVTSVVYIPRQIFPELLQSVARCTWRVIQPNDDVVMPLLPGPVFS